MPWWATAVLTEIPPVTLLKPEGPPGLLRGITWTVVGGLLGVSALLALLSHGDPSSRRLIELVTLTPLGLPLATLGALGALGLLVTARRRRSSLAATGLAIALVVVHGWWLAPLYLGARPSGGPGSLVVLTQNFEYGDAEALAATTRARDVDVLVLLEVTPAHLHELQATGIESWLPHVDGFDDEQDLGTVVFSRLPFTAARPLFDGAESREVELDVPGTGPVSLVAVHTRPPYTPGPWRTDHEQVARALTAMRADDQAAIVLTGDFNATLAHAPMRRLLDLGFSDAAEQVNGGWSRTWPIGGYERRLGIDVPAFAEIDHVLTSPRLAVTRAETLRVAGADHAAVLATIAGPAG